MGRSTVITLILATLVHARQETYVSRASELDRRVAVGDRGDAAVGELWAMIEELEPLVSAGTLDLDRGHAFVLGVCRLAQLAPDRRPQGFEVLPLLEMACFGADVVGDVELQANARFRWGQELLRGSGHAPDFEEARTVFVTALEELTGARATRPFLLLALAKLECDFGSLEDGMDLAVQAEESLKYARADHRPLLEASLAGLLIELEISLGAPNQALPHVQRLEALARSSNRPREVLLARVGRIHLLLATRQWARAHRYATEALAGNALLPEPYRSTLEIARGQAGVTGGIGGRAELRSIAKALEAVADDPGVGFARRVRASFWSAEASWRLGERAVSIAQVAKARAKLEQIPIGDPGQGLTENAYWLDGFESRIARTQGLDREQLETRRQKLAHSLAALIARWKETPVREGGVGFLHFENRREPVIEAIALGIHLDEQAGVREGLELLLQLQGYGTFARSRGISPRIEKPLEGLVGRDSGCLVLLPGLHSGFVFAADADGVLFGRMPGSVEIETDRRRLIEQVSRPPSHPEDQAWRVPATDLSMGLLPPAIRSRLRRWHTVHVVGADVLGYIPFELLPLGKEAGSELLGEALAVDYLSSVHVGQFLYRRNLGRSESTGLDMTLFSAPVVVSAVTKSWPEARSIPFGDSHAEALLAPYRKAQEWRGKAATLEALASGSVMGSRVLHVLTHGVVDPERVHPVGLVFADGTNGVAWHSELSKLAYPPLVIVTACEVASMNSLRGEDGVASLANMFLAGGADAALVSPVRQDLNDATELASAVHRHVASGASVAEAVRRARRAFRAKPERAHPFHSLIHVIGWGGVQLFGERR